MNKRNYGSRCQHRYCDRPQAKKQTVNIPNGVQSLAMVYTISQTWRGIDDSECGFCRGTIFDELDKPFYGDGKEVDCRGREK